jgi:hypothetical protein
VCLLLQDLVQRCLCPVTVCVCLLLQDLVQSRVFGANNFLAFVAKCKGPRQRAWKRSARCRALFAAASMCDNLVWQSRTCRLHPAPHCVKMLPAPVRQDYWRLFLASAVWPGPVL